MCERVKSSKNWKLLTLFSLLIVKVNINSYLFSFISIFSHLVSTLEKKSRIQQRICRYIFFLHISCNFTAIQRGYFSGYFLTFNITLKSVHAQSGETNKKVTLDTFVNIKFSVELIT